MAAALGTPSEEFAAAAQLVGVSAAAWPAGAPPPVPGEISLTGAAGWPFAVADHARNGAASRDAARRRGGRRPVVDGGELIDLSMRDVAAAFAAAPDHGPHDVLPGGSVACPRWHREQVVLPPRRPVPPAGAAAHAAELGTDTSAVLAQLSGQHAAC